MKTDKLIDEVVSVLKEQLLFEAAYDLGNLSYEIEKLIRNLGVYKEEIAAMKAANPTIISSSSLKKLIIALQGIDTALGRSIKRAKTKEVEE